MSFSPSEPRYGYLFQSTRCRSNVREIEGIRARLIQAELSGFTDQTREEIRAEIRIELSRE